VITLPRAFLSAVIVLLVLSTVLPAIPVVRAAPATLVVDDDGQASPTDCNATDTAYTSIQAAISAASDGDEIVVCPGTYNEQITINKNGLKVRSFDGSAVDGTPDTVIEPNELHPAAVVISGNDNEFVGFYIKDSTTGHPHVHRGIFVQGDRNIVKNNLIEGRGNVSTDVGILVRGEGVGDGVARDNQILNNIVTNIVNGILSVSVASDRAASDTTVQFNYVHDVFYVGIAADRSPNTIIMFNEVVNNKIGIYYRSTPALSGAGTEVRCNNIYGNSQYDAQNEATDGSILLAELNWWGSPGGPDPSKISGDVDYDPWLPFQWDETGCDGAVTVGRITGSGFIVGDMTVGSGEVTVWLNFIFNLHCDVSKSPNILRIVWRPLPGGPIHIFDLTNMETGFCLETDADQGTPLASFDTHIGYGTGNFRVGSSPWQTASVRWRFVDAGEPGQDTDELFIEIVTSAETYILSGRISYGNIQARDDDP